MNMCTLKVTTHYSLCLHQKLKEKRMCTETATIYALKYLDKSLISSNVRALWISFYPPSLTDPPLLTTPLWISLTPLTDPPFENPLMITEAM